LPYRKRLNKVASKLFTFLDYDGVPWNNNGAEHAVKSFMKFKRTSDGLFTERSLTEALVMLSILETCKLNGVKRLGFLLSGKTDLASVLGGHPRTSSTLFGKLVTESIGLSRRVSPCRSRKSINASAPTASARIITPTR
jgi:hypothetical protein